MGRRPLGSVWVASQQVAEPRDRAVQKSRYMKHGRGVEIRRANALGDTPVQPVTILPAIRMESYRPRPEAIAPEWVVGQFE